MKAIAVCSNTIQLLEREKQIHGVIHSVFNRVCNIETTDRMLIPIISTDIPNMPRCISLHIPQELSMHSLGLERGKEIVIQNNLLRTIDAGFQLELGGAKIWEGSPDFSYAKLEEQYMLRNLEILKDTLLEHGKLNGIASIVTQAEKYLKKIDYSDVHLVNQYCVFIWPRFLKLIQWILDENVYEIQNTARQIVGFGIGLTPSADDLLAGIMIAMIYGANYYDLNKEHICMINDAIVEGVEHRTTKVSAEMLCFASKGEVSDNVRQLVISIFSENDESLLNNRIDSVINNGETSGSDCIAGIFIGCLISAIKNKERKMKDEVEC